jgi:hypothetical protein
MMLKLKIVLFVLVVLSFNTCQEKDITIEFPKNLKLSETISSDCLSHSKSLKSEEYGYVSFVLGGNYIEVSAYIHTHCGAQMTFEMEITPDNKIILKEVDKAINFANCLCSFTFSTRIENVIIGVTYEIEVWNKDMTVLIDTETFRL